MFTSRTYAKRAWSRKNEQIKVDMRQIGIKPIACVAAISVRYGLDHLMLFEKSVNTPKFREFVSRLRAKYPFRKMALFMDNLSLHRSKAV